MGEKVFAPVLYPVSFLIAAVLLLPGIADKMDWQLPLMGIIGIPAVGLDYIGTLFHETGHTLFLWLFGYPAVPTFDFNYGGGMTYSFTRSMPLLYMVYFLSLLGVVQLIRRQHYILAGVAAAFAAAHAAVAFNDVHEAVWLFMGQGTEMAVGAFCILRGIIGHDEYGAAERWLNMIFGFFISGKNAVMCWGLITDDVQRYAYEAQKGGHGMGDFSRIAEMFNAKIEIVAGVGFVFGLALAGAAAVVGYANRRDA